MPITVEPEQVTLTRNLAWGQERRVSETTTANPDGRTEIVNAVTHWLDPWYTNI